MTSFWHYDHQKHPISVRNLSDEFLFYTTVKCLLLVIFIISTICNVKMQFKKKNMIFNEISSNYLVSNNNVQFYVVIDDHLELTVDYHHCTLDNMCKRMVLHISFLIELMILSHN